ncbi:MAG: LysR family transcriptional regulator [Myxococcota bacterium]
MHETHLSQIDLNLLVYLDHLLRERSVTKAAARAGITQSAMSRALNRLREQLSDKILVQVGRSMEPTERALALQAPLNDVLARIRNQIFAPHEFVPATARRSFSIAGPDYVDALVCGPLAARFAVESPSIDLNVVGMGPAVRGEILDGRLDLLLGFPPANKASIHARRILADRFVAVVRKDHPGLRRKKLPMKQYVAYPHVLVAPGGRPGSYVDRALADEGLSRRVAVRLHSFLLVPDFLLDTDYILTVPEKLAQRMATRHALHVTDLPIVLPGLTLSMVWHTRNQADPAHRWLRQQVLEIASAL